MRIFVTGGTGFIGSNFLNAASEAGHQVIAHRRPGSTPPIPVSDAVKWQEAQLENWLSDLPSEKCPPPQGQALVHFAAYGVTPANASWENCFKINVIDSIRCWQNACEAGIRRFVIAGSCFEYGRSAEATEFLTTETPLLPTAAYHASKAAASMGAIAFCSEKRVNLSILRLFHVFGEGEAQDRFWPALRRAALAGEDFPMTLGEQIRDFIPVEDVAAQFLEDLEDSPSPGKVRLRNIGTGHPQSLRNFAETWWQRWGACGKLKFGAKPYREGEVMRYVPHI
jgi:nucleoside-diphosphate-sugar epimerase